MTRLQKSVNYLIDLIDDTTHALQEFSMQETASPPPATVPNEDDDVMVCGEKFGEEGG